MCVVVVQVVVVFASVDDYFLPLIERRADEVEQSLFRIVPLSRVVPLLFHCSLEEVVGTKETQEAVLKEKKCRN